MGGSVLLLGESFYIFPLCKFFSILCVWVFLRACVDSLEVELGWLRVAIWVQKTEPKSSVRAVSALNHSEPLY